MAVRISSNPAVLAGKPCVTGTRISVEFILESLASGAGREEFLRAYPQVTAEGLAAALEYAAKSMRNEVVWEVTVPA